MRSSCTAVLAFALLLACLLPTLGWTQQACPVPPSIEVPSRQANIFSDQQEIDLGDAMAESLVHQFKIIREDALTAYLRTMGDRVAQHLPPTQLKFRFYLIELPEVNAFSIAGGRVYISRKIVALAKTDDELAGVIAHELGHIVTHQSAIQTTARLRDVLGVTEVGDRADIFNKFHLLLENSGRKPDRRHSEEEKQYVADQVALYAMARAGYAPHAYVDLWDRFQQTRGKTGSWLSDLFGSTKPSERRLREMLRNVAALPAGCADIQPGSRSDEFAKWQAEVINYSGLGSEEALPGLVLKQEVARPLRPDVSHLRFSPDGKYVLAQDEGGIHVLTRDPFAVLFYIPAAGARNAAFSPDSRSVVFHTRGLRVESWSIPDQRRNWVHELTVLHPCIQSELSPDGSTLACLNTQFELSLIEVASGSTLASKKSFVQPTAMGQCVAAMSLAEGGDAQLIDMKFSPDSQYFVAGASGAHFAWQLSAHRELSLPGSIREILNSSFAFIAPDQIVGIDVMAAHKSSILRFPSGERLERVRLRNGLVLRGATHGDYFLVGPVKDGRMGLFDVKNGTLPITFKTAAADIYDDTFVTERLGGELALNVLGKMDAIATVKLPQARLGPLRAAAISPDLNWLLLSNRSRGAVWDITHNIRTMEMRSFQGAWFSSEGSAYVDFPKFGDAEREIVRLDPAMGRANSGYKVGDVLAHQHGPYLLVTSPRHGNGTSKLNLSPEVLCWRMMFRRLFSDVSLLEAATDEDWELRDVRDGHVLWSHYFPHEVPAFSFGADGLLLRWPLTDTAARDELAKFPDLKNSAEKTDYLVEQVDLRQSVPTAQLLIKTNKGSFGLTHTFSQGDWVIASATGNEVLTYSLASREQKGRYFGTYPVASQNGFLAVEGEAGQLKLYDMASSQLKQQYLFPDPISLKTFSLDGKRMFVMTASQTAYIFDLTASN